MLRSGISKFSTQQSRIKSDFLVAESRLTSAIDRLTEYQNEKTELKRKLPVMIRSLQFFLSLINFFLFMFYVLLFAFTISSSIMAYTEDCLRSPPNYAILPERVVPNTLSGFNYTGFRLIEKNDYSQISLLILLMSAIGLQMISSNLAFVGSITLTTKNTKMYIWLFVLSTIMLIVFFMFDFPLKKGKQYIKYFGAYKTPFLFFMLIAAISHVFSGFFSIVLLLQWSNFINDINKVL